MNSIHLVLSLVASFKWEVLQMDVKYVFLHGDLHGEIYMEKPLGFIQKDSSLVRNPFMVSSKTLRVGMQKLIDFF